MFGDVGRAQIRVGFRCNSRELPFAQLLWIT